MTETTYAVEYRDKGMWDTIDTRYDIMQAVSLMYAEWMRDPDCNYRVYVEGGECIAFIDKRGEAL